MAAISKILVTVTQHFVGICKDKYICQRKNVLSDHRYKRTNTATNCQILVTEMSFNTK